MKKIKNSFILIFALMVAVANFQMVAAASCSNISSNGNTISIGGNCFTPSGNSQIKSLLGNSCSDGSCVIPNNKNCSVLDSSCGTNNKNCTTSDSSCQTSNKTSAVKGASASNKDCTTSDCYSKSTVKQVQKCLNKLGYSCGKVDGKYDSKVKKAIKEYQKDCGSSLTNGKISNSLVKNLNKKACK